MEAILLSMMKYKTRDSDVSGDLDILLAKFSDTFTGDDIRKPAGEIGRAHV